MRETINVVLTIVIIALFCIGVYAAIAIGIASVLNIIGLHIPMWLAFLIGTALLIACVLTINVGSNEEGDVA